METQLVTEGGRCWQSAPVQLRGVVLHSIEQRAASGEEPCRIDPSSPQAVNPPSSQQDDGHQLTQPRIGRQTRQIASHIGPRSVGESGTDLKPKPTLRARLKARALGVGLIDYLGGPSPRWARAVESYWKGNGSPSGSRAQDMSPNPSPDPKAERPPEWALAQAMADRDENDIAERDARAWEFVRDFENERHDEDDDPDAGGEG